ncbi:branched-chain amino acid ABC transporter permease [Aquicoccus sp. G2-2]|uniref:branched-chain amino acid ABC transporter permease n=1 Tax=Aquicoccus sp. G2-2 TaxID=3092120 RepID=UPI002ADFC134|nr:branched-chain amino acid ABC transporter permease [Aquicoccus sp. G2-2]MEA1113721.1 branched-chain amino acid ABC transporter permease [Aquicoccus sp. G2-2]
MSTSSNTPLTAGTRNLLPLKHVLPWVAAIVVLLLLPHIFDSRSALTIMNQMAITIVFALSYNMLLGQGGMLSFGHAVYMGLGGFFAMHILNWVETDELWLPLPLLPIFGGLFGLLFAFLIGSFSTRRAGTVFAMISLGVGELVASSALIIVMFFGGEEGISGDRTMGPPLLNWDFGPLYQVYYLTAFWLVLAALGMFLYSRTPIGRITNAVRDNEERAEFLGYSQRNVRWISFCASGFFAGIAGALFAINFEILTEENLNLVTSGNILLVTFLGGVGFFAGPIIGAIVFTLLQTVLSLYTEIWALYLGILFVATVMFFLRGWPGFWRCTGCRGSSAGRDYWWCLTPRCCCRHCWRSLAVLRRWRFCSTCAIRVWGIMKWIFMASPSTAIHHLPLALPLWRQRSGFSSPSGWHRG